MNVNCKKLPKRLQTLTPNENIAAIFASAAEDNFAEEGRPDKWIDLSEVTKNNVKKSENIPDRFFKYQGSLPRQ